MDQLRTRVRAIILALTGVIVTLLLIRFILIFVAADQTHFLVKLVLDVSYIFVYPFISFGYGGVLSSIDANALIAMLIYVVLGILISEVVTAFMQDDPNEIIIQFIDAVFKIVEFLLISRIILKIFNIQPGAGMFVQQVYTLSEWSSGILPSRDLLGGKLEISAIIVLIIVVLIDIATEGFLSAVAKRLREARADRVKESKPAETVKVTAPAAAPAPAPVVIAPPAAAPQNITINVPIPVAPQQPQAPRVERQIINVQAPASQPVQPIQQAQQINPAALPTQPRSPQPGLQNAEKITVREG